MNAVAETTITIGIGMSRKVKVGALALFCVSVWLIGLFFIHQIKAYGCREDPVTATVPECGK